MTLDKAVIQLGANEAFPCMSYVALSRIRKLSDLMIIQPYFTLDRSSKDPFKKEREAMRKETVRLGFEYDAQLQKVLDLEQKVTETRKRNNSKEEDEVESESDGDVVQSNDEEDVQVKKRNTRLRKRPKKLING